VSEVGRDVRIGISMMVEMSRRVSFCEEVRQVMRRESLVTEMFSRGPVI
jgi:hypothetical protein